MCKMIIHGWTPCVKGSKTVKTDCVVLGKKQYNFLTIHQGDGNMLKIQIVYCTCLTLHRPGREPGR